MISPGHVLQFIQGRFFAVKLEGDKNEGIGIPVGRVKHVLKMRESTPTVVSPYPHLS